MRDRMMETVEALYGKSVGASDGCGTVTVSIETLMTRVASLEAALRRCNDAATEAGNDKRHTRYEREVARGIGAIIRKEMAGLGME